ncbi:hypothetical protein SCHPADRAFT_935622 [Schizopora paradoxa]|uniref:Uncharacterized protein n=1 Tax=Schizopora paradoxa TaxID=27342 RepID=A0A0H2S448_9AGAM|nr:hypothetical protein SCHPADRAFT_935622 [Schizopora paradoxa]
MAPEASDNDCDLATISEKDSFVQELREAGLLDCRAFPQRSEEVHSNLEKGYQRVMRQMECMTERFKDEKIIERSLSAISDPTTSRFGQLMKLQGTLSEYSADTTKMIAAMELIHEALLAAEKDVEEEAATSNGCSITKEALIDEGKV